MMEIYPSNGMINPGKINVARLLVLSFFLPGLTANKALARDYFDSHFLQIGGGPQTTTDLSAYDNAHSQAPGNYRVDIWLNNHFLETKTLPFIAAKDPENQGALSPCITLTQLKSWGVKVEAFSALQAHSQCVNMAVIPSATTKFEFSSQRLMLSIPQAALKSEARGYVSPEQFDEGIPALLLNYRFSGANNYARKGGTDSNNQYLNLRPGANFGAWRLRNYSTWSRNSRGNQRWDTAYTYLQRNIISLKSQLTLGDSNSPSDIFDSVPFRGVQLASDDEMLPESLRGYAPVIRGTAKSNAQVIVRQNGYVIYQSYVAPGAFVINDMYATGGSGDLNVTIKEADGSEQHFVVPYASLPVLQREGRLKFSLTGGQYRPYDSAVDKKFLSQATAIYGLPKNFTLYGGLQLAENYRALASGIGKNLGDFGALSADVTQAWSILHNREHQSGQSWRVRYNKNIIATGTNFAIAGYRYSTAGYYTLSDVMDSYHDSGYRSMHEQTRNRTELTVSQNISQELGSFSLSLLREEYWQKRRKNMSMSAGYNNSWNGINYGVNYSYSNNSIRSNEDRERHTDRVLSFNVSVPLDRWLRNSWATYSVTTSKPGGSTNSVGLSGTSLADNNLAWNIQQSRANQGQGSSGNLDGDYRGTYGEVTAGYGYDRNMQRLNYGLEGGILAHSEGVTFGQAFGDTAALIAAPGASGVEVTNQTGVKTDFRGYALVPNLSPYRQSDLELAPDSLPDNVDLSLTTKTVVPTRGAIVRADYQAQVGFRVLATLLHQGVPLPFGAVVSDPQQSGKQSGIVGDNGQVYLNGLAPAGTMLAQWGKGSDKQCYFKYQLAESSPQSGIQQITAQCLSAR